jgi:hypothetical protein
MNNHTGLRLPDFIGVGPARTGTTWLHWVLAHHVGMPRRFKEVHFFDRYYSKGLAWYARNFEEYPAQLKAGEITPRYFHTPEARVRIAKDIPGCKIVCSLREPVARMHSVYKLMCHLGSITEPSFECAIDKFPSTKLNQYDSADVLRGWLTDFGRERILVCLYDDLEKDPQAYLNRITDFIDAPRIALAESRATKRIHSIGGAPRRPRLAGMLWRYHRSMDRDRSYTFRRILKYLGIWQYCFRDGDRFPSLDRDFANRLRERFVGDVEALEEILGRDLSAWKPHSRKLSCVPPTP